MDEVEETYMVQRALDRLIDVDSIWAKNFNSFLSMTPTARIWWWRAAMMKLLTEVIKLRMLK